MTRETSVWGLTGAIVISLGACVAGCGSDTGTAPAPPPDGTDGGAPPAAIGNAVDAGASGHAPGACMLEVSLASTGCTSCAQQNCCEQVQACFSHPACTAFELCLSKCSSGSGLKDCQNACVSGAAKSTLDQHNAWAPNCMAMKCAAQCGL